MSILFITLFGFLHHDKNPVLPGQPSFQTFSKPANIFFISENKLFTFCPINICPGDNFLDGEVRNTGTANGGPYPVTGVKVNGSMSAGMMYEGATMGQGTASAPGGTTFTLNIGSMNPFQIVSFRLYFNGEGLNDQINMMLTQNEFNPGSQTQSSCMIEYQQCADIEVIKMASADTINVDEEFEFKVVVRNNGPGTAANVKFEDMVSIGFEVVDITPSSLCQFDEDENFVSCNLGNIPAGDSICVIIGARGDLTGKFSNVASATTTSMDSEPQNNTSDSVFVVMLDTIADIQVMKSADVTDVKVGDPVTFTIKIRNNGPQAAHGVKLEDYLPTYPNEVGGGQIPNFDLESVPQGCQLSNHELTCEFGTLQPGEEREITVRGYPVAKRNLSNHAFGSSTGPHDPALDNNDAFVKVHTIGDYSTSGGNPDGAVHADPVSTYNGEFILEEPDDLFLHGPNALHFDRYYASFLHKSSYTPGILGPNWSHLFDWRLVRHGAFAEVYSYKGQVFGFEKIGNTWACITHPLAYQLVENGNQFLFANIKFQTIYIFNVSGSLVRVERMNGVGVDLVYQNGKLQEITDGLGRAFTLAYNGQGLLSQISDGSRSVNYQYSDSLLISATNVAGNTTSYQYDLQHEIRGLMTARILPGTNKSLTYQEYNENGQVTSQHDAYNQATQFSYDGLSTSAIDPRNNATSYEHTADGHHTEYRNAANIGFSVDYDANGRRMSSTDQYNLQTLFEYDPVSGLMQQAQYEDDTFKISYRAFSIKGLIFYKPDTVYYSPGSYSTYEYDGQGQMIAMVNRAGDRATFSYNELGQTISSQLNSQALGSRSIQYDTTGMMTSIVIGEEDTIRYEYDPLFRLIKVNHPDGSFNEITYDQRDQVLTRIDQSGQQLTYTYDPNGGVTSIRHSSGPEVKFTYDDMLRKSLFIDAAGDSIHFTYDQVGNIASVTDRMGNVTTIGHDNQNHPVSVSQNELVYTTTYDVSGYLNGISLPGGREMKYAIDPNGLIKNISIADFPVASFNYNANGKVESVSFPSGYGYQLGYKPNGVLSSVELPSNIGMSIETNEAGLPVEVTDPNGGSWKYQYNDHLQLLSEENPLGHKMNYQYNENGQIDAVEGSGKAMQINYEGSGYPASVSYADGTLLNYQYDDLGRLISTEGVFLIYNEKGAILTSNGIHLLRNNENMITRVEYSDSYGVDYALDHNGRIVSLQDNLGNNVVFSHSVDGDIETITRSNNTTTSISRDQLNRITNIQHKNGEVLASSILHYDSDSRMTSAERKSPVLPVPADLTIQLEYNQGHQENSFQYDVLGNVIVDQQRSYLWNDAGQLKQYTENGETTTFTHDGLGNRTSKQDANNTYTYTWIYGLQIPQPGIISKAGGDTYYNVYLPDGNLIYSVNPLTNDIYFFHFDERGNTTLITDKNGNVVAGYAYSPYGESYGIGFDPVGAFTFGGEYGTLTEPGKNLYQMHRRFYDAETGRFLSGEPNANRIDPRTISPYVYALQSPMNFRDKTGYDPEPAQKDGLGIDGLNLAGTLTFVAGTAITGLDIAPELPGFLFPKGWADIFHVVSNTSGQPSSWSIVGRHLNTGRAWVSSGLSNSYPGFTRYLRNYAQQAQRHFNTALKWKNGGKVIGTAGSALGIYSVFNVLKEADKNIDKSLDPFVRNLESHIENEGRQIDELIRLLKSGRINKSEFEQRVREVQQATNEAVDGVWNSLYQNLGFEGLDAFAKALETFLPNPTDGSLSNGIYGLTGSDVSVFRQ